MNQWFEQYIVVVRRTSISCMLELVVVRLATISSVCILKRTSKQDMKIKSLMKAAGGIYLIKEYIGIDLVRSRDSSGSIRLRTAKIQGQVPRPWSRDPTSGFLESNLAGSTRTSGSTNSANIGNPVICIFYAHPVCNFV